jgi:peroxiredoxin
MFFIKSVRYVLLALVLTFSSTMVQAEKAPDFSLFDQSGNAITLKSYLGKGLIIHFWGTWCPYCRQLQPGLDQLYRKYKASGLEVLAISIGEQKGSNPAQVLKEQGISFLTAVNGDKVARMYNVPGTPSTFFIDREGEIVGVSHSSDAIESDMEAKVRQILYLDQ